jgi:hypothetical protein
MTVALVAMFVGLVWAPTASAASDPIASGTTTLTLNKGLVKKLKKNGVKILKVSPATLRNRTATLPVTGGSLDPTSGAGTINHSGGIKFKRGKKTVALKNLIVDTTTKSLTGRVGKKSLKIASVAGVSFARNGFGVDVKISKLKLTGKAAKELNNKLSTPKKKGKGSSASASKRKTTKLFKGGQVLGSSSSTEQPSTVTVLPQGDATLVADATPGQAFSKFIAKGVSAATGFTGIAPATRPAPTVFVFPISGGTIAPNASSGTVNTAGGVQIVKDTATLDPTMQLTNIGADLGTKVALTDLNILPSPPFPGNVGRASIADLDFSGATIVSDPATRRITIIGAVAKLQAVAAATLNDVFNQPPPPPPPATDFAPGDSLGTFSFTVQTQ